MKALRRRIDRIFEEQIGRNADRMSTNKIDRMADLTMRTATQFELQELISIGDRQISEPGDEARLDEIMEAIIARSEARPN